ncbi:MAG: phosphate signaling complex protein PhoU [Pseudomonadota bacterium]
MTPSSTKHTVKAFDTDMVELRGLVSDIGGRAEKAVIDAMTALERNDHGLASSIIVKDKDIDELERAIDRMVVQIMALRAPMADDLRVLIATLKISSKIERIGDYAKNIAKRVPLIDPDDWMEAADALDPMSRAAIELVDDAMNAYARRDADLAIQVCKRDKMVDDFYSAIFRGLIDHMIAVPGQVNAGVHLMFIAKNLERIGDHATNIAEMVYFSITGENLVERDRGNDPLDMND